MKKMRWSLALLFSAGFVFASCLKDDSRDITYYDDTAITALVLILMLLMMTLPRHLQN